MSLASCRYCTLLSLRVWGGETVENANAHTHSHAHTLTLTCSDLSSFRIFVSAFICFEMDSSLWDLSWVCGRGGGGTGNTNMCAPDSTY